MTSFYWLSGLALGAAIIYGIHKVIGMEEEAAQCRRMRIAAAAQATRWGMERVPDRQGNLWGRGE